MKDSAWPASHTPFDKIDRTVFIPDRITNGSTSLVSLQCRFLVYSTIQTLKPIGNLGVRFTQFA